MSLPGALWVGYLGAVSPYTHLVDFQTFDLECSKTNRSDYNNVKIKELLLIQVTPNEETRLFCEKLAKTLREKMPFSCTIHDIGIPISTMNSAKTMPLFVFTEPRTPPEHDVSSPAKFKKWGKRFPNLAEQFKNDRITEEIKRRVKSASIFHITTGNPFQTRYSYNGLKISEQIPEFRITYDTASESGDQSLEHRRIARHLSRQLIELLQQQKGRCNLPEIAMPKIPEDAFIPDFIHSPELIYRGQSPGSDAHLVWRFELQSPEQQLLNFKKKMKDLKLHAVQQEQSLSCVAIGRDVIISMNFPWRNTEKSSQPEYGLLTYQRRTRPGEIAVPEKWEPFLDAIRKNDPQSFIFQQGLQTLRGEKLQTAFDELRANPQLSFQEKDALLQATDNKEAAGQLAEQRRQLFYEMTDEVLKLQDGSMLQHLTTLFRRIDKMPETREYLASKLPYLEVSMPKTPNDEGIYVYETKIRKEPLVPSLQIIDLKLPNGTVERLKFMLTREADPKLGYVLYGDMVTRLPVLREGTLLKRQTKNSSSFSSFRPKESSYEEAELKPGEWITEQTLLPDEQSVAFKVSYRPLESEEPPTRETIHTP